MHSRTIASAFAVARIASPRRIGTHTMAPTPPRRHRRALAILGLVATGAVAAFTPSGANAQPVDVAGAQSTRATTSRHAAQVRQDLRSPDARDAAEGRGTFNSPQIVVVKAPPPPQPAITDGIDWADAGIGAGSLLGLGMITLAGALAITHRRRAADDAHAAGL
jgi:hypothetical protein